MSKYKVGDKFIVEIESVGKFLVAPGDLFRLKGIDATLSEKELDGLHKVDSNMKIEDIDDMIDEYDTEKKGYNKGLQDTWELVRKIFVTGGATLQKVFGTSDEGQIIMTIEPQEALAKIEAYEKAQEIQVGDVVIGSLFSGVVTGVDDERVFVLYDDGSCGERRKSDLKKTGKHIHIQALLQEIGGE